MHVEDKVPNNEEKPNWRLSKERVRPEETERQRESGNGFWYRGCFCLLLGINQTKKQRQTPYLAIFCAHYLSILGSLLVFSEDERKMPIRTLRFA